jgi:hypothetical protein
VRKVGGRDGLGECGNLVDVEQMLCHCSCCDLRESSTLIEIFYIPVTAVTRTDAVVNKQPDCLLQ